MTVRRRWLTACAAPALIASCSSHSPAPVPRGEQSTTASSSASAATSTGARNSPSAGPGETVRTDAASGQTVALHVGQRLRVVLRSTYWRFGTPPDGTVLASGSPPVIYVNKDCIAGGGCGSVTQTFTARGQGHAVVAAARTSCGEALACTPQQSAFSLSVVVTP